MSVLLKWVTPDPEFGWTHTRVYRSDTESGTYTELTSAAIKDYVDGSGVPIASSDANDTTGDSTKYYKIRFFDSVNNVASAYSDAVQINYIRGYISLDEARQFTNLQSAEYDDRALQASIDAVTTAIDTRTNRTWQGLQTETDQYLDGDGSDSITLPKGDISSITSIAIDDDGDGTYTSLTSSDYFIYLDEGILALKSTSKISRFPKARQCVKITYVHGNAEPTYEVKQLALFMLVNSFDSENKNIDKITSGIKALQRHNFTSV